MKRKEKDKDQDLFWYSSLENIPPPSNFIPGLIPVLKTALIESHKKGNTRRAALCFEETVNVTKEAWDRTWGCGYRNFEMICTALMAQQTQPTYFALLDSPSVRNLQAWIEKAWNEGFDPEGQQQLGNLVGTKKWIGTSDMWVAFSSRGIPAELVDFNLKKSPKGVGCLTDWIVEYFTPSRERVHNTVDDALRGASPVTCTDQMPIILQYKGHSQTIVGYEISKKGAVNLLKFDSSEYTSKLRKLIPVNSQPLPSSSGRGLRDIFYNLPKQSRKRGASNAPPEKENATKRPRSDNVIDLVEDEDDDEIIIISDSRDINTSQKPQSKTQANREAGQSAAEVLRLFRLESQKLQNDQYQILYFPLEHPLDEQQRLSRKEVTSTRIC